MARVDDRTLAAQAAQAEAELMRAEAAVAQASSQIDSARATAEQAATGRGRTQRLRDAGTVTQAQLDVDVAADLTAAAALQTAQDGLAVAQAQVTQAEAARDIARMNLSNAVIRAPVAGVVSARFGQIGALAGGGGEPLFRIIRDGEVELEAQVIETALAGISVGDGVEVTVAGIGATTGTVRRVDPTVNAVNRLGTVRIGLDADGLRPGSFAGGWVVTQRDKAAGVPTSAVLTDTDGDFVLRVVDGVLERAPVDAGLLWQDRRAIMQGLSDGDEVVARAGAFFAPGDRVDTRPEGEADMPAAPAPAPAAEAEATE